MRLSRYRASAPTWAVLCIGKRKNTTASLSLPQRCFRPNPGKATEGPPAAAKQSLEKFPLKVEKGLLYISVPVDSLAMQEAKSPAGSLCRQISQ